MSTIALCKNLRKVDSVDQLMCFKIASISTVWLALLVLAALVPWALKTLESTPLCSNIFLTQCPTVLDPTGATGLT